MTLPQIWNLILYMPLLNLLVFFYHSLGDNLGWSIIALTFLIKVVTYPLTKPSLEMAKKQRALQPQIEKLKKKYKNKEAFAKKQMELYKQNGVNIAAGCLPQIVQLFVFLALYRVFTNILMNNGVTMDTFNNDLYNYDFLKFSVGEKLNPWFLGLDLSRKSYFVAALAAITQFFSSKVMMKPVQKVEKTVHNTPDKSDDVMYNMQQQMVYMLPIMTFVVGIGLPAGLGFYWFISTGVSLAQFYFVSDKFIEWKKNKFKQTLLKS